MMAYLTVHIRGWDPRHIAKHIDVLAMGRDRGVFGLKNISHKVLSKFGNVVTVDKDFDQRFVPVPEKEAQAVDSPPRALACLGLLDVELPRPAQERLFRGCHVCGKNTAQALVLITLVFTQAYK